jgi:hypothetical protein
MRESFVPPELAFARLASIQKNNRGAQQKEPQFIVPNFNTVLVKGSWCRKRKILRSFFLEFCFPSQNKG